MDESYVTVIGEKGHPTRLVVAAKVRNVIAHSRLNAMRTDLEAARAEAQAAYPDRLVIIPAAGDRFPEKRVLVAVA